MQKHYWSYKNYFLQEIIWKTGEYTPYFNLKVFVSEHAKWPPDQHGRGFHTHALSGCLAGAEFLLRMLARPEIGAATYHVHNGLQWAVIAKDTESGELYRCGTYDMLKLFGATPFGLPVVTHVLEGEYANPQKDDMALSCAAVTDRETGTLYLLFVNSLENTAREVRIQAENQYRLSEIHVLTAPEILSVNRAGDQQIKLIREKSQDKNKVSGLLVPPRSFSLFKLEKIR